MNLRKFIFIFGIFALHSAPTFSQTRIPTVSYQELREKECTDQKMTEARTYAFRQLKTPEGWKGRYGKDKKPWFQRVFPFLAPPEKYLPGDISILDKKYGKPVPLGESKRSITIRTAAEQKLAQVQADGERKWQEWLVQNPNATEEERSKAEFKFRYQGANAAKLSKFDWREHGVNTGEVGDQGNDCNVCWAFTAVDVLQASRQIAAMRSGEKEPDNSLRPSVRQLMSCMVPKAKNICEERWHGDVLSFLVDNGLPLGGARKYNNEKQVWTCEAKEYLKALTWDFVSAKPQNITPPDELKTALVTYGPVLTLLRSDRCFRLYGSGIFNEDFHQGGNHFVSIIGWDDSKSAWLIKNSYGTDWGDAGFAWVKYGANEIGKFAAVVIADPDEETRIFKK